MESYLLDLVWHSHLLQYLFSPVPLLRGKNHIRLRRSDRQRRFHIFELFLFNERRMSAVPGVGFAQVRPVVANDILGAEAVAYCADFLDIIISPSFAGTK